MSLPKDPYHKVKVKFHDCHLGFIHWDLSVENQSITIQMSEYYDPVPDLIR